MMSPDLPKRRIGAIQTTPLWLAWLLIALGLASLYIPTCIDLYQHFWQTDQNSHGPIVLAIAVWLFGFKGRAALEELGDSIAPLPILGAIVFIVGLLTYTLGRSQSVLVLEMGAAIPTLVGISLFLFGSEVTKRLWFAFFFLLFTIPMPGSLTDALTQPLKIGVSWASEHLLHAMGYPIARAGVTLYLGQFQLLVADACAGLHSLFTLEALGLLYLNVIRHESVLRNAMLAALIVPVSFTANTIRVVTLALITFHLGDEAGQGFLHGFSGMVLFMSALILIIGIDAGLRKLGHLRAKPTPPNPV